MKRGKKTCKKINRNKLEKPKWVPEKKGGVLNNMTNKLDKIYTYRIPHPNIGGHFILYQVHIECLQKSDYILIFGKSLTPPLGLIIH